MNEGTLITVIIVGLIICYIPYIFYLLTLQKTLKLVGEEHQAMSPGLVWLNLIPIFVLGWHFYTVSKVSTSLGRWHSANEELDPDNGANTMGITACALMIASIIPFIGGFLGLAALIVWIIYWVKIAGYNKKLKVAQ